MFIYFRYFLCAEYLKFGKTQHHIRLRPNILQNCLILGFGSLPKIIRCTPNNNVFLGSNETRHRQNYTWVVWRHIAWTALPPPSPLPQATEWKLESKLLPGQAQSPLLTVKNYNDIEKNEIWRVVVCTVTVYVWLSLFKVIKYNIKQVFSLYLIIIHYHVHNIFIF